MSMTLPASPPLSMSQIAHELGLPLPFTINTSKPLSSNWPYLLAGLGGGLGPLPPISFSNLLGKTGRFDGSLTAQLAGNPFWLWSVSFGDAPFFGGTINNLSIHGNAGGQTDAPILTFDVAPNWPNKILVKNNTTGASAVLNLTTGVQWTGSAFVANLIRAPGTVDSFTILPSN